MQQRTHKHGFLLLLLLFFFFPRDGPVTVNRRPFGWHVCTCGSR